MADWPANSQPEFTAGLGFGGLSAATGTGVETKTTPATSDPIKNDSYDGKCLAGRGTLQITPLTAIPRPEVVVKLPGVALAPEEEGTSARI
jgi:hypothetical protein